MNGTHDSMITSLLLVAGVHARSLTQGRVGTIGIRPPTLDGESWVVTIDITATESVCGVADGLVAALEALLGDAKEDCT